MFKSFARRDITFKLTLDVAGPSPAVAPLEFHPIPIQEIPKVGTDGPRKP